MPILHIENNDSGLAARTIVNELVDVVNDLENTYLPLAGGTMSSSAAISFVNSSKLQQGTTDTGLGGAGGIALKCSLDYEFKWEAGRLYVMNQTGTVIRESLYNFSSAPTIYSDDANGYIIGSRWALDSGITYICVDNTTSAAVWIPEPISLGPNHVQLAMIGTPTENFNELKYWHSSYASSLSLSTTNRFTIVVPPCRIESDGSWGLGISYIDLASLTGQCDVLFTGSYNFEVKGDDIRITGIDVGTLEFHIEGNLPNNTYTNCKGGAQSFGGYNPITTGIFNNCISTDRYAFSGDGGVEAAGTYNNCVSIEYSFGSGGTASGVFNNCIGGDNSFGSNGIANGEFTNCIGTTNSFGAQGTASGTFTNCKGGVHAFGGGSGGEANGTFVNCIGGDDSFGGTGVASGNFINCQGGNGAFGTTTVSGVFNSCIGGNHSFGDSAGTLSGKLYYCRISTGTSFPTVSGGGITRYCINGNDTTDNQG